MTQGSSQGAVLRARGRCGVWAAAASTLIVVVAQLWFLWDWQGRWLHPLIITRAIVARWAVPLFGGGVFCVSARLHA